MATTTDTPVDPLAGAMLSRPAPAGHELLNTYTARGVVRRAKFVQAVQQLPEKGMLIAVFDTLSHSPGKSSLPVESDRRILGLTECVDLIDSLCAGDVEERLAAFLKYASSNFNGTSVTLRDAKAAVRLVSPETAGDEDFKTVKAYVRKRLLSNGPLSIFEAADMLKRTHLVLATLTDFMNSLQFDMTSDDAVVTQREMDACSQLLVELLPQKAIDRGTVKRRQFEAGFSDIGPERVVQAVFNHISGGADSASLHDVTAWMQRMFAAKEGEGQLILLRSLGISNGISAQGLADLILDVVNDDCDASNKRSPEQAAAAAAAAMDISSISGIGLDIVLHAVGSGHELLEALQCLGEGRTRADEEIMRKVTQDVIMAVRVDGEKLPDESSTKRSLLTSLLLLQYGIIIATLFIKFSWPAALAPVVMDKLNIDEAANAAHFSFPSLASAIFAFMMPMLVSRYGRDGFRNITVSLSVIEGFCVLIGARSQWYPLTLASRVFLGCSSNSFTATLLLMAELLSPSWFVIGVAILNIAADGSSSLGALLFPRLSWEAFSTVFVVIAMLPLTFTLIAIIIERALAGKTPLPAFWARRCCCGSRPVLPPPRYGQSLSTTSKVPLGTRFAQRVRVMRHGGVTGAFKRVWRKGGPFLLVPITCLFLGYPQTAFLPIAPLLIVKVRGVSLEAANVAVSASGMASSVWSMVFAILLEKVGHRAALAALVMLPMPIAYLLLLYTDISAGTVMLINGIGATSAGMVAFSLPTWLYRHEPTVVPAAQMLQGVAYNVGAAGGAQVVGVLQSLASGAADPVDRFASSIIFLAAALGVCCVLLLVINCLSIRNRERGVTETTAARRKRLEAAMAAKKQAAEAIAESSGDEVDTASAVVTVGASGGEEVKEQAAPAAAAEDVNLIIQQVAVVEQPAQATAAAVVPAGMGTDGSDSNADDDDATGGAEDEVTDDVSGSNADGTTEASGADEVELLSS